VKSARFYPSILSLVVLLTAGCGANLLAEMAHTRPGVFKGQVRGVSHQGQEKTLHLKAGYIDADFPSFETFPLHSHGGPYIRQVRRTTGLGRARYSSPVESTGSGRSVLCYHRDR